MEKLNFNEFDYLGMFRLKDVFGIEDFVEPLGEEYLSRNKLYYSKKSGKQLSEEWNYLNSLLPCSGKKGFVIAEQMLNCSCRIYYEDFKAKLAGSKNNLESAKKCLENDVANIIRIIGRKRARKTKLHFPEIKKTTDGRFIEADNKKILYQFIRNLPAQKFMLSPLYGGILIGPFFKELHSLPYAHVLFGMHDQGSFQYTKNGCVDLKKIMSGEIDNIPAEITIFDDNAGTGETLAILKKSFEREGRKVKTGAFEMSWDYYDQIKNGKRNGNLFDLKKIDYLSYYSTRHHKITKYFVEGLKRGGETYQKRLKALGFLNRFLSDDELLYFRGKSICRRYGINFEDFSGIQSNLVLSVDILDSKIRYMENESTDEATKIILDYPVVNIIDLDRYQGKTPRIKLINKMLKLRDCRVGGGIRNKEDIKLLLKMGAKKVIVGTSASKELLGSFPREKIIVAIDSIDRTTGKRKNIPKIIRELESYCDEFQYVCVETDGKAMGGDIDNAIRYSKLTKNKFNCVGGIAYKKEMLKLAKHGIGCVVGRAIEEGYFG